MSRRRLLCALSLGVLATTAASAAGAPPAGDQAVAGCVECDILYAADSTRLWRLDPVAGTATVIGPTPAMLSDLAISADGRLFGNTFFGDLWELDPCTAAGQVVAGPVQFQGLGGLPAPPRPAHGPRSPASPSSLGLYSEGPPLTRIDLPSYSQTPIGASPAWCPAIVAGDLAVDPGDGLVYVSVGEPIHLKQESAPSPPPVCPFCFAGQSLIVVSPVSGDMTAVVGCFHDPNGEVPMYGLAFDGGRQLWGVGFGLYRIDAGSAAAEPVPLSGGFSFANALASLPCRR